MEISKQIRALLKKMLLLKYSTKQALRWLVEISSVLVIFVYVVCYLSVSENLHFGISYEELFANFILWNITYFGLKLHQDRVRFFTLRSFIPLIKFVIIIGIGSYSISLMISGLKTEIRSAIFTLVTANILVVIRLLLREILRDVKLSNRRSVIICGISDSTQALINTLAFSQKYRVTALLDHTFYQLKSQKNSLHLLSGLPVICWDQLQEFTQENDVDLVIIQKNEIPKNDLQSVLSRLEMYKLSVNYAPDLEEFLSLEVQLSPVDAEDYLTRPVHINFGAKLKNDLIGSTVFISGAGGSIGSELCRQVLALLPTKMILCDLSEIALYKLEQELSFLISENNYVTNITYQLASVTDVKWLEKVFDEENIDHVYHAAAYKHVPIVENNIVFSIKNNIVGSYELYGFNWYNVKKFVLVSSDKQCVQQI